MPDRTRENLSLIDELWALHEHRDPESVIDGNCLAFVIDPRFVESTDTPGLQFRLGVSFGDNPFTPEMKTGFVPPPVRPGKLIFGIHLVATKDGKLTIYDEWYDSRAAGQCNDPVTACEMAREILAAIPDPDYRRHVESDESGSFGRTEGLEFSAVEVVRGEAF